MKTSKHRVRKQGRMSLAFLAGTIAVAALLGTSDRGHGQELNVDERLNTLEQRLETLNERLQEAKPIDVETVEDRLKRLESRSTVAAATQTETDWDQVGNMVFFRGGGAWLTNDRGNEVFTDVFGTFGGGPQNDGNAGYYVGAGLNLVLSKDMWGMMSKTWLLGEIGVEFKRFDSKTVAQAVPSTATTAIVTPGTPSIFNRKVQLTMLTVDIAPKIMFMEGSRFRPWIIPVGLDFHVISPPSNDTTVLDIGAQFAVGAQYRIWKALHLGVDGRFHLAANQTDTVNNFGTVGGYIGIGF